MRAKVDKKYRELASSMFERDKGIKQDQAHYRRMADLEYALPESLSKLDWIIPSISTSPNDSCRGVTRALSNLEEALDIDPVTVMKAVDGDDEGQEAIRTANLWEKIMQWELGRSAKRKRNLRSDVIWDATVQDEVAAQLIHLPTEFKITKPSPARKRAAMRFGDWAIRLADIEGVYVDYSDYMPERVLCITIRTAQELLNQWGEKRLSELVKRVKKEEAHKQELYVEYDMVDHDDGRKVWYHAGEKPDAGMDGNYILKPEPWMKDKSGEQVPFLPWICVSGGKERKPLLFAVKKAGLWETTNILRTIVMSKAIATAAAPEHLFIGPGSEEMAVNYTIPGGSISLPTKALHGYEKLPDSRLDPQLTEGVDRSEADMSRASVSDVLVTAQPISGEQAYASYNLQVQQALASIGNIKELGERFFEQLNETMLLIAHFTGESIESYMGGSKKYVIDSEDIDPDSIQLHVELKTDVPIDRLARINAASQLAGSDIPYSFKQILKDLGDTDPEGTYREWTKEQFDKADIAGRLEFIQAQQSGKIMELAQQMAQQLHEQMMQQQAEMAKQQEKDQNQNPENVLKTRGVDNIEGQGFNPAAGGTPPAMAADGGVNRERAREAIGLESVGRP